MEGLERQIPLESSSIASPVALAPFFPFPRQRGEAFFSSFSLIASLPGEH